MIALKFLIVSVVYIVFQNLIEDRSEMKRLKKLRRKQKERIMNYENKTIIKISI